MMVLVKKELEKLETEVATLKKALDQLEGRIKEHGGDKVKYWSFRIENRIREIEEKVADLKTDKIRTDELTPEELKIEKRIIQIEAKLGLIESNFREEIPWQKLQQMISQK